ncbi:MAG: ATP12 family protein [Aestuariivirga sp.]|nr:ATP12 family protein [Aestuariivirga sp.]
MSDETEDERWERLSQDRIHRPLPKRFYKSVAVTDRLGIALDGRTVKTPLKAALVLPTRPLADTVAAEWDAQVDVISPHAMPLTKLANTAIDRATTEKFKIAAEILEFAGSDMVCYRAEGPAGLVQRQTTHWDPIMAWAKADLNVGFETVNTVAHRRQSPAALQALEAHINSLDPFSFVAVHNLTALTGSALLAAMVATGEISADAAWLAANVDEDWQIATWGEDDEAMARRAGRLNEFSASVKFVCLARGLP